MSFKDDFIEAFRSVKRDFFREHEYTDQDKKEAAAQREREAPPEEPKISFQQPERQELATPTTFGFQDEEADASQPIDDDVFEAFRQASALSDNAEQIDDYEDDSPADTAPYRRFESEALVPEPREDGRHTIEDFDNGNVYDDTKTIISRNTVIRGAVQTMDSIRLLGQVMGDIDCKSNIVVAGKVRGNTTAANAYIFDAQVDGDVRCEDIISISNDAWVLGNIRAQQAEIDGKIKGNIEIRHMVSIGSTSSVLGDISTDELEIKRGAFINGQIMMYSPSRDVIDRFDSFDK